MEFNSNDFRYISVARLKRELEKCEDSKDAFMNLIDSQPSVNYYWRIVIFRKDLKGGMLEVAGFLDKRVANNFIENIIKKNPSWDESILGVERFWYQLPPWIADDYNLANKLRYLLKIDENMEDENA